MSFPFERVTGPFKSLTRLLSVYQENLRWSQVQSSSPLSWYTNSDESCRYVADANVQNTTAAMRKERICGRRKLPRQQCEKKEYVANANVQTTTLANLLEFSKCIRVGGPNVTGDSNPNNWFKLMPVPGPSCFPLKKQDPSFCKDCLFCWCEIAPLDSYFLTVRIFIFKSSSNLSILVILVPTWLKSVFSAQLWGTGQFYFKLLINRSLALFQFQLTTR